MQYEPKFDYPDVIKNKDRVQIDEIGLVPTTTAFGKVNLKSLKKSYTRLASSREKLITTINNSTFGRMSSKA